jgi:branched-chain amino acid transport system ATP-binding protein
VFALFPRLKERLHQLAGSLSGGEQQMLALGRALMSNPKMLLLDEPSLGLAPILVKEIYSKIVELHEEQKISILLVEQNVDIALTASHRAYVLEKGQIVLYGLSSDLRSHPVIQTAYLGG